MESVEVSGKNVAEAIAAALVELGANRDEVEVEVVNPGRGGLLGLGAEEARVRVSRKAGPSLPDAQVAALAHEVLEELLKRMDVRAQIRPRSTPDETAGRVHLDVYGDDLGILIGRRGITLSSLQFMVNLIVGRQLKTRPLIDVDVEGYRQRRAEALQALALRMAERVTATGQPVTLEPMPAAERRLIHLALRDHPGVAAQSVGEGESRKVIISIRQP